MQTTPRLYLEVPHGVGALPCLCSLTFARWGLHSAAEASGTSMPASALRHACNSAGQKTQDRVLQLGELASKGPGPAPASA